MDPMTPTVEDVRLLVIETLGIEERAGSISPSTSLLTSVPELDSMAVLEVVDVLQGRFDITIEDEDVTAEVFESVATLWELVDAKVRAGRAD